MIGRGFGFPVALEWALKLKELAGVFAEPFSAADYRHGPIALAVGRRAGIHRSSSRAPRAPTCAASATTCGSAVRGSCASPTRAAPICALPVADEWLAPIPAAIVGQLLAFWLARARGRDPDRPIGITKVTRTL